MAMLLQYISAEKLNTTAKPKTLNPCVEFLEWIDEILQICLVVESKNSEHCIQQLPLPRAHRAAEGGERAHRRQNAECY